MHGYELPLAMWGCEQRKMVTRFQPDKLFNNCCEQRSLTKLLQLSSLDFGVIFLADTTFKKKKAKILVIQK